MHKYKIFLKSGETVEVLAKSIVVICDKHGLRFDFLKNEEPRCMAQPSAIFYVEYIKGWVELPEREDK